MTMINTILVAISDHLYDADIIFNLTNPSREESLNEQYGHLRMTREGLESVNLGYAYGNIRTKQRKVWKPFITIMVYTVRQMANVSPLNKYYELVQEECDLESMVNEAIETTEK